MDNFGNEDNLVWKTAPGPSLKDPTQIFLGILLSFCGVFLLFTYSSYLACFIAQPLQLASMYSVRLWFFKDKGWTHCKLNLQSCKTFYQSNALVLKYIIRSDPNLIRISIEKQFLIQGIDYLFEVILIFKIFLTFEVVLIFEHASHFILTSSALTLA